MSSVTYFVAVILVLTLGGCTFHEEGEALPHEDVIYFDEDGERIHGGTI